MKLFAFLILTCAVAFAQHNDYQVGILQNHVANTERIGTDFNGINCGDGRCVGSAAGIYQNSNWWNVRVGGADGYWEMQPNWQENSGHNPLNAAKEGDKVLFRIAKRHYLNGTFDVAYLPRADNPEKEIMLLVKWVPDHPVVGSKPQPKSQLEAMCESGKLLPDQQEKLCGQPSPVYRAGISFLPGANFLQVLIVDPASPNQALLQKFITYVEGERGTGPELQAKLNTAIAKHQDGTPIKITLSDGPGSPERDGDLKLFAVPSQN